jgi:hypothetical protein
VIRRPSRTNYQTFVRSRASPPSRERASLSRDRRRVADPETLAGTIRVVREASDSTFDVPSADVGCLRQRRRNAGRPDRGVGHCLGDGATIDDGSVGGSVAAERTVEVVGDAESEGAGRRTLQRGVGRRRLQRERHTAGRDRSTGERRRRDFRLHESDGERTGLGRVLTDGRRPLIVVDPRTLRRETHANEQRVQKTPVRGGKLVGHDDQRRVHGPLRISRASAHRRRSSAPRRAGASARHGRRRAAPRERRRCSTRGT